MSTINRSDVNEFGRDPRSANALFGTAQSPIRLNEKLIGCGCFGCSSLVVIAGLLILLVVILGFLIPDLKTNYRYVANSGVVLDKRIDSKMFDVARVKGGGVDQRESYRPEIKIRYEVKGRKFESWCYDASGVYYEDRAAQQAIADSFQVGTTYPCWYDPDRPEQAILVRGHSWGAYAFLIVPLGLFIIGGAGIWMARMLATYRPAPIASGGSPVEAATVPGPVRWLQNVATVGSSFDPSQIGDPLAMKIDWSPMTVVGGNFQIYRLVEVDPDRLVYRVTVGAVVFALVFLVPGVLVTVFVLQGMVSSLMRGVLNLSGAIGLVIGPFFAAVGGYMLNTWRSPIVFDRQRGLFSKGRNAPDEGFDGNSPKNTVHFNAIHALQLIRIRNSQYQGYEINLVLVDGERRHVVAYGAQNRNRPREDAATLARFLGKPVWDAI